MISILGVAIGRNVSVFAANDDLSLLSKKIFGWYRVSKNCYIHNPPIICYHNENLQSEVYYVGEI